MTNTRANTAAILTPEQVADLVVRPALAASLTRATTIVHTSSSAWRAPVVTRDPQAAWVAEGEEIPVSDLLLDEVTVTPAKLAGLSIVTSELASDSSPAAAEAIGAGLVRDIARKLDAAFLGNLGAPAPAGLESLTGVAAVTNGTNTTVFDSLVVGLAEAEKNGGNVTAWIAHPDDVVTLSLAKSATGVPLPIVGIGEAAAGHRTVFGIPLLSSPAATKGTMWGIPAGQTYTVVRQDATVETDSSVYFTSDRVAVRAKLRVGFGFTNPAAVVKVTLA